jgi:competence ComEA-like helix-hairpin-helix protein
VSCSWVGQDGGTGFSLWTGALAPVMLLLASSAPAQSLPEGPGKDLVEAVCTACHDPARIIAKQATKAEWQAKILEMLQECPDVTQDERNQIAVYLAKNFPKHVNVNAAPAKELESVLEVSSTEAEAVVRYREEKGAFHSAEDLKKVPGFDSAKVEAIRNRLEF